MRTRKLKTVMPVVAVLIVLWAISNTGPGPQADSSPRQDQVTVTGVTSVRLQYQGRLTDTATGQAVDDGSYSMTFRLYTVASGGTALWTETKDVAVQGGLFNTALGDTTALAQSLFNGQELWLGVTVGADAEATPRQRLLPVAYALSLVPGAAVQANSSSAALQLTNLGSGEALRVNGQTTLTGNLAVSGSLTGGSHAHSGGDITSGTVAEARIDAALTRDSEVMSRVFASDGTGSSLDADLLDGQHGSAFAGASHAHSGGDITSGTVAEARIDAALTRDSEVMSRVLAGDGAGSSLDADLLDGQHGSAFAGASHAHWGASWSGSGTGLTLSGGTTGLSATGSDRGVSGTGGTGVYGASSAYSGQAVQGYGSGAYTEGVLGTSDLAVGVFGISSASSGGNAIGVWGQTGATWGFYTGQSLYVGGSCVGCTVAYIAQSEDAAPLEAGDVVLISGIAPPLADGQTPILKVRRAGTGDDGLLGVVQSRVVLETAQALMPSTDGLQRDKTEIAGRAPGRVAPGDYLFVVVQGLAQVRVDASAVAIMVGDPVGPASASGAALKADLQTASAPVVGHALEPLSEGTGLVWVLVLGR